MTKLNILTREGQPLGDVGYKTAEGAKAIGIVGEVTLVSIDGVAAGTGTYSIGVIGAHTDIDQIINVTNVATGTTRVEFSPAPYPYWNLHFKCTGGVIMTVWSTNNSAANTGADANWVNISEDFMGATGGLVDDEGIYFADRPTMPLKVMIKYVTSDSTNEINAYLRRHAL